ncbi:DUF397 domain-containing protein [Streptomyces flavidovirens]|uniref:DUF397 domain-containing protein n=1 Tax=Streptomyces flavidovirens TaxID=67298 RepID=UPI000995F479|nr:DUF397 domain-containing protein [Streptomyces flavidovirens]
MNKAPTAAQLAAAGWFKSSYSGGEGNECVEVAALGSRVAVRDSKITQGPVLAVTAYAFAAFLGGVKGDELSAAARQELPR